MRRPGVVIFSPPWPRSGTSNIIAAQAHIHRMRGEDVYILLEPLGWWDSKDRQERWRNITDAFRFHETTCVDYPRVKHFSISRRLSARLGGCPDTVTVTADFAASGELPPSLLAFLDCHDIAMLRVNHVFGIKLALRVKREAAERNSGEPSIVLDTHDVQSHQFRLNGRANLLSGRMDSAEFMLKGELALAAEADLLVHISKPDFDFFASALPRHIHLHVPPTLNPDIEERLTAERYKPASHEVDFVYLGNDHAGNLADVKWLLSEVLPRLGHSPIKLRIVGTIQALFKGREPQLFRRHRDLFVGEIPSPMTAYRTAKAVLAPAVVGTGASIKLIEALCSAKPVVTTTIGMRGAPVGIKSGDELVIADHPQVFAEAMVNIISQGNYHSKGNAAIYDAVFSNSEYAKSLGRIAQELVQPEIMADALT